MDVSRIDLMRVLAWSAADRERAEEALSLVYQSVEAGAWLPGAKRLAARLKKPSRALTFARTYGDVFRYFGLAKRGVMPFADPAQRAADNLDWTFRYGAASRQHLIALEHDLSLLRRDAALPEELEVVAFAADFIATFKPVLTIIEELDAQDAALHKARTRRKKVAQ